MMCPSGCMEDRISWRSVTMKCFDPVREKQLVEALWEKAKTQILTKNDLAQGKGETVNQWMVEGETCTRIVMTQGLPTINAIEEPTSKIGSKSNACRPALMTGIGSRWTAEGTTTCFTEEPVMMCPSGCMEDRISWRSVTMKCFDPVREKHLVEALWEKAKTQILTKNDLAQGKGETVNQWMVEGETCTRIVMTQGLPTIETFEEPTRNFKTESDTCRPTRMTDISFKSRSERTKICFSNEPVLKCPQGCSDGFIAWKSVSMKCFDTRAEKQLVEFLMFKARTTILTNGDLADGNGEWFEKDVAFSMTCRPDRMRTGLVNLETIEEPNSYMESIERPKTYMETGSRICKPTPKTKIRYHDHDTTVCFSEEPILKCRGLGCTDKKHYKKRVTYRCFDKTTSPFVDGLIEKAETEILTMADLSQGDFYTETNKETFDEKCKIGVMDSGLSRIAGFETPLPTTNLEANERSCRPSIKTKILYTHHAIIICFSEVPILKCRGDGCTGEEEWSFEREVTYRCFDKTINPFVPTLIEKVHTEGILTKEDLSQGSFYTETINETMNVRCKVAV